MNSKIINVVCFTVGAAIGVGSSWFYFKKKYEDQAKKDLDERMTRDNNYDITGITYYGPLSPDTIEPINPDTVDNVVPLTVPFKPSMIPEKPALSEYASMVKQMNYSAFSSKGSETKKAEVVVEPTEPDDPPYVINPEEFGEEDGYDMVTLTYYSDGTLTDEDDELVEDIDGMVGRDALTRFRDFKVEAVYVRNDRFKSDYEIISDLRRFDDVLADGIRHRR